jgi:hypothetical protein
MVGSSVRRSLQAKRKRTRCERITTPAAVALYHRDRRPKLTTERPRTALLMAIEKTSRGVRIEGRMERDDAGVNVSDIMM